MNRSQIMYKFLKATLLLLSSAVFWVGNAFAQSAGDVEITATAKDAHCIQNGEVTVTVTKKTGSPYTPKKITYDLRDDKGNSLAGASGQFVENNLFNGLKKGIYKAYAKVVFQNNVEIQVGPVEAIVNSNYKIPTVAIKLERKTLKSFKPSGVSTPQPTGVISVLVTGGNRPSYKVVLTEKPAAYTGPTEIPLELDKKIFMHHLPAGTYKFQVHDECGGQEVQTVEMEAVKFDAPQGGVIPFAAHPRASEETRNQCGWFYFSFQQRGVSQFEGQDQDLQPYLSPTVSLSTTTTTVSPQDSLVKYYDYGFGYGNNQPSQYYAVGESPFVDNMDATGRLAAERDKYKWVFGRIQKGKKWSDAGFVDRTKTPHVNTMNNDVFPGLFLRLKGSPDRTPKGYRNQIIKNLPEEFTIRWYTIVDSCAITYKVNVKPAESSTELFCYPISVGLFASDKTTRLGTAQDVLLTKMGQATNFNDYILQGGNTYWIKATDGTGSYVEYPVRIVNDFKYTGVAKPSVETNMFDICKRMRGTSIELSRHTPTTIPFLNHDVTLVSAPAGYTPGPDGLAVGETFSFPKTFPSGVTSVSRFYAFGKKSQFFTVKREIFAPNGKYLFRIYDRVCKKSHDVEVEITTAKTPLWTVNKDNFKPRLVNASCGRVRIYPFTKENRDNFMFKSEFWQVESGGQTTFVQGPVSHPRDLMIYVDKFPEGISKSDVTHNFPSGSTWVWQYHTAMWWVSAEPNNENLYIELPKTNGEIVLKVAPFSRHTEYDKVFKDLTCMPEYPINLFNIPLSYERETYIGYSCKGSLSGHLFIVPTNNVGGVKIELFREGESLPFATETLTKENVSKGAGFDLVGTAEKPIPGKLRAKLTDLQCGNFNDESIIIYNLDSPDIIRTPNQQRKYCEGETIRLSVINLGNNVTYSWKLPNGQMMTGQKIEIPNATFAHSGEYEVHIQNILCAGLPTETTLKFTISVAPLELWWRKDAKDANWHNLENWAKRDGTPVQAVPAPCTVVHIPAKVDKAFPDLAGEVTKRDIYGAPECNDIYFHYGSQLGTPQQLSYHNAYVDYNFGKMGGDGSITAYVEQGHPTADSKLMERNRWYMIATPLKDMVSGDFGVGGYPKTYQRYLKVSTTTPLTDASFTKPFNSQVEPLSKYNHAMALRVAGHQSGKVGYSNHARLNMLDGIFRLPFFENPRSASAYDHHTYDSGTQTSTFRYYNENTLALTNRTDSYKRTLPDAYRFVFESNTPGRRGKIGNILVGGVNTEGYSLSAKPTGTTNDWVMLGNPFMTPMDFDKFLEVNQDNIEPYYYLFTENAWKVYTKATAPASNLSKEIAPLQSIVVRRKGAGELLFPTSGTKSVLLPAWREGVSGPYNLKNAEEEAIVEIPLTVNVANEEGDYSQAFLGWSSGVCAPVFVNNEYASVPTVFMVEPDAGDYNAITYPTRAHGMIQLGVSSSLSAPLTLSFDHIDRSVYEELTLIDKHEGVEQDLLSNPKYDFMNRPDTTPATRFALRIKRFGITNVTTNEELPLAEFKMYDAAGKLRVESTQPLHRVAIYDMQGKTLADEVLTDNATRIIEVDTNNTQGVVVVEVFFKNGMRTVRKYDLR